MREYLKAEIERYERLLDSMGHSAALRCCVVVKIDTLRSVLAHLDRAAPVEYITPLVGSGSVEAVWAVSPGAGLDHVRNA